ncbi:MAG: DNA repair protein RecO [Clostridiales bacterium]|nr:DNA repair protein RecO [Candidatus Blautia equi]
MSDLITVQGVVLSAMPVGEYDRRIELLTRERGRISAFAKGARRQNSPFMAVTTPFVFGTFTLFEGKTSYNLSQVAVQHQFTELSQIQPGIYYGYYFLELAQYFGREGTDEKEMMNLLYVTVKALLKKDMDPRLVRCIFELRTMTEQGMMPVLTECGGCGESVPEDGCFISQEAHGVLCDACSRMAKDAWRISAAALYTMRYIVSVPMGKLYTFRVTDEVLSELERFIHLYVSKNTDRRFKTLDILQVMCS